jgi:YgiT-type zinc finger domain-containing protein
MNPKCNVCGCEIIEKSKTEYLYSYKGRYLLVPNTPVEVCLSCGMVYYSAKVLKEIESHFFAIENKTEEPDEYLAIPTLDLSLSFENIQ